MALSNFKKVGLLMPRLISAPFFDAIPVFSRAEYAAAVGRLSNDKVVTEMLAQHLEAGNIKRVARGVFASVPKHIDASKWSVDRFLAASRLRGGSIVAYHSALELHGYAYTIGHEVQIIAQGDPGIVQTADFSCRFVKPPRGSLVEGVMAVDRLGLEVQVTTIEQTIADIFDRYDLGGGAEEIFNSLDLIPRVNAAALLKHMRALNNATAAGALGYWLEREQGRLGVDDATIKKLRASAPKQARYALGAKPKHGRMAKGWNVILPASVVEQQFEGM